MELLELKTELTLISINVNECITMVNNSIYKINSISDSRSYEIDEEVVKVGNKLHNLEVKLKKLLVDIKLELPIFLKSYIKRVEQLLLNFKSVYNSILILQTFSYQLYYVWLMTASLYDVMNGDIGYTIEESCVEEQKKNILDLGLLLKDFKQETIQVNEMLVIKNNRG